MKIALKITIIVLALSTSFQVFSEVNGKDASENIGRYQLFQGEYPTYDVKNNKIDVGRDLFLLDTATGRVYKYSTGIGSDGKVFERWVIAGKSDD